MAWDHLDVNRPHLVYIILGGFTSLFMLCSSVIKERMYIGEATVATICGIIFGPHAADLINPDTWGNTDQITLEFSRIVLVVQCFAVGVELPRHYMEKHWRSVTFLLVPVMTFGWLVTSLFIWATLNDKLSWLDSLVCAACVTATDPVLASSVVGKGKFAKRVPKHLRDLLSAESGCNDGMAFPFIYLGIYITRYLGNPDEVAKEWFLVTILYECVFGAIYGFTIGFIARKGIRFAHDRDMVDRESFLVFYFVLALFCAGSGSILGMDDLLIGFACGVGFSNDGWFSEKTDESAVSNVIDLLINLAFFVYFGTIIPWEQYNSPDVLGTSPWRLVVIALLVLFFRRIPIMMALKPVIPDIKTWREALFAGHFGPIGVGAIFVAILARGELEHDNTTPLAEIPGPGFPHRNIIELIWPITTFLVITSIIVHGSSIAVFTLGKHINTLTLTMSYTQATDDSGNWMDRLPRIQSRSKSSMSKNDASEEELDEKMLDFPSPTAMPRNFLRRQKDDTFKPARSYGSGSSARHRHKRSNAGGPISQSAITPQTRSFSTDDLEKSDSKLSDEKLDSSSPDTIGSDQEVSSPTTPRTEEKPEMEVYREGPQDTVIEDEKGNVIEVMHEPRDETEEDKEKDLEGELSKLTSEQQREGATGHLEDNEGHDVASLEKSSTSKGWKSKLGQWRQLSKGQGSEKKQVQQEQQESEQARRSAPARAFRFGRTIIVEDEDGEVIKKYDIPAPENSGGNALARTTSYVDPERTKTRIAKMGHWLGVGGSAAVPEGDEGSPTRPQPQRKQSTADVLSDDEDRGIRFTVDGHDRRMSKAEFIKQIQQLDPKSRAEIVEESNVPEPMKQEARQDAREQIKEERRASANRENLPELGKVAERPNLMTLPSERAIPIHSVHRDLEQAHDRKAETAAERRRRLATGKTANPKHDNFEGGFESQISPLTEEALSAARLDGDSDDDGTERVPRSKQRTERQEPSPPAPQPSQKEEETAAERRRREGALGLIKDESDSDEDESKPRQPGKGAIPGYPVSDSPSGPSSGGIRFTEERPKSSGPSIRFADQKRTAMKR